MRYKKGDFCIVIGWVVIGWVVIGWVVIGWVVIGWVVIGWVVIGWVVSVWRQESGFPLRIRDLLLPPDMEKKMFFSPPS